MKNNNVQIKKKCSTKSELMLKNVISLVEKNYAWQVSAV